LIKKLTLLIFLLWFPTAPSQIKPPNYDFSLDNLTIFYPGKSLKKVQTKFGKGEKYKTIENLEIHKFYVAQIRYKFPVFIQVYKDKILDFFARLPSYFSHDLFHQSLINRYGMQNKYLKHERNATYIWQNKKGIDLIYAGTCTITCFPIFLSGKVTVPNKQLIHYRPITDHMKKNRLY